MAEEKIESPQSQETKKRRWSVGRIILILFLSMLAACMAFWLIANAVLNARLRAEVARYRAASQPIELYEFDSPDVPDEQNAAIPIKKAARLVCGDHAMSEFLLDHHDPAFVKTNRATIDEFLNRNPAAIKLIIEARSLPQASLGHKYPKPQMYYYFVLPRFYDYLEMSRFNSIRAVAAAMDGDSVAALEDVGDIQNCIRCIVSTPCWFEMMSRLEMEHRLWCTMEAILPKLTVPGDRSQAARLTEMLNQLKQSRLDDSDLINNAKLMCYIARGCNYSAVGYVANGAVSGPKGGIDIPKWEPAIRYPSLPLVKKFCLSEMHVWDVTSQAVAAGNYHQAQEMIAAAKPTDNVVNRTCEKVAEIWELVGDAELIERFLPIYFSRLAERRMMATAIAMKQYEWDNGDAPTKLTDLVPKYLSAIPRDPFSPSGESVKLGAWGGRRLLYSVGIDGVDLAGQYGPTVDEVSSLLSGGKFNIPFFLDGDRPVPASTSMPAKLPPAAAKP